MEINLDPNTIQHVHHLLVYRCETNDSVFFQNRLNHPDNCYLPDSDDDPCGEVLWAWAHGERLNVVQLIDRCFSLGNARECWISNGKF